ncbi:MAG: hypothetical protein QOD51_2091 [Candidatus Eremiobacteraeota bacterium]|nr:hypothetical protein [Candidatus Eremiobacteraeota bacterium]
MYQLASDARHLDTTRLFIQTCTSMAASSDNMNLVESVTTLVRNVLNGADIKPLRDFLTRAEEWCSDLDDVLAAAGQTVIDEMNDFSRIGLHDVVSRVAQIERDALGIRRSSTGTTLRPVYAG